MEFNIEESNTREYFFTVLMKLFAVIDRMRLRLIVENPWNTNTPHWKRIRASGRKLKMYYDIHCFYEPNRNQRVYEPALIQEALKEVDSYE